jgi:methyl-accepting chemotaxis protein
MSIHSIRVKLMVPILALAVVLAGLFGAMLLVSSMQKESLRVQSEIYFEAIALVLNADRDIYQAQLAQLRIFTGQGELTANKQDYEENADQVLSRFRKFREHLADEPELTAEFEDFDQLYAEWSRASQHLTESSIARNGVVRELETLDTKFYRIRDMLDRAGEDLRDYAREMGSQPGQQENLSRYLQAMFEVVNADRDLYQARVAQQQVVSGIESSEGERDGFDENSKQVLMRFHTFQTLMQQEMSVDETYKDFDAYYTDWLESSKRVMESPDIGRITSLPASFDVAKEKFEQIREVLDQAGEQVRRHAHNQKAIMNDNLKTFQNIATLVIVGAFAVAMTAGYYLPLTVTRTLDTMTDRIREIAAGDGDLTQRINSDAKDELGHLANEFDGFVETLRGIMQNAQRQASALGGMTGELEDSSQRTDRITRSLVTVSDTLVDAGREMTDSNEHMAGIASQTSAESQTSSELSQQGIGAVQASHKAVSELAQDIERALTHSNELEKSSMAIASVLEVIRNIAEQTNLLALNAAIEAARAGEQGRGFAVVADEVRTLATRTQDSTNEIEAMIDQLKVDVQKSSGAIRNSRKNADFTVSNFDQVTSIFGQLSDSFESVKRMAGETAQATQSQAQLSNDIGNNLASLKQETDGVKEVSALISSKSLQISDLYRGLNQEIGRFKV